MKNYIFIVGVFILGSTVHTQACINSEIAQTTVYYLPDAKKICGRYGVQCPKFLSEVAMQGSGRLQPGEILRKSGHVEKLESCQTTIGSARQCLIPYVSVAADPSYYEKGDIIYIPSMKNQKVKLSNGQSAHHPGYFIVQDVGGRIIGESRFDFFTIDEDLHNVNNSFGYRAKPETRFYSVSTCEDYKKFELIKPDSEIYSIAKTEINKFQRKVNQ